MLVGWSRQATKQSEQPHLALLALAFALSHACPHLPACCAVAGLPRLSQADVLVCSRGGGGLLKERMALARSLWDAGLSAELLPQAAPSLTEQYEYAQSRASRGSSSFTPPHLKVGVWLWLAGWGL